MNIREELHRLVDTLPEGALENAKDVLEHLQILPPQPPPPPPPPPPDVPPAGLH